MAHGEGNGIGYVERAPVGNSEQHDRHQDIEHSADAQRPQYADGKIATRISRFLRGHWNSFETDICEENHPRSGENAADAELAECALVRWNKRCEVMQVDIWKT